MGVMKRLSGIVQAKTNKLLDKAEDPRESLDLSYQKQLESLQQVRRSVADVTTAKKRIELQAGQIQQQADKLQQQAKAALGQDNEDPGPRGPGPPGGARRAAHRAPDPAPAGGGPGGQADRHRQEAPGPGRRLPDQEGDHEGHLHGGRGPDQDRRGRLGHLRVDERRRHVDAAGPGQDRQHAGPGRGHGRAAGVGGPHQPQPAGRRHPGRAGQGPGHRHRGQRAGGHEGRAGRGGPVGRAARRQPRRRPAEGTAEAGS